MLKKAILTLAFCLSLFLLWFAVYNYRQAEPIAEENLRGLALSVAAAIENLAVNDPSLAGLAAYRTNDIAYFALVDRQGRYRFHSNPDLAGKTVDDREFLARLARDPRSEERVTLGTGERAFQYVAPLHLPGETLILRLTLHSFRADAVLRRARIDTAILVGLLAAVWLLAAALIRYARREELHRLELARREHLVKLGEMGAMLAHEIRNPLGGIKGFAQVIARKPDALRNAGFAQQIVGEAVRLETLVNELLAYSVSEPAAKAPLDLAELVERSAALLDPEALERGVEVVLHAPEHLPVLGSRDRLEQVLLNLGKNALQAMPDGGTLRIEAVAAGGDALVTVADSGCGIDGEDLPRVFDPFFTTKPRGTGLGLALCKKIVEEHRGVVAIASAAGDGTSVTVTLPLSGATKGT